MAEIPSVQLAPAILSLQTAIVACQPKSLIQFSLRYLQEEKQVPTSLLPVYHALQMLPYLTTQQDEMRDLACTIFCALQTQNNIFGTDRNTTGVNAEVLPNPPSSVNTTFFREYLDGNLVSEVIQYMDLPSLGQSHTIIDEILIDRIESLKRVDFNLFFVSIRLYLNVYQAIAWLKDDILDYLWTTENVLRVPVPLTDDFSIELTKWKVTLLKRNAVSGTSNLGNSLVPSSSTSKAVGSLPLTSTSKQALRQSPNRFTHNYHRHVHGSATTIANLLNTDSSSSGHHNNNYGEQDVLKWKRILLSVLEEERTALVISVGIVVERFVKELLQYK